MAREMRETAERIHKAYGAEALHFLEVGVELETWTVNDRLALFRLCDVYLNCAMRDGLNLLPFEYVLTKCTEAASVPHPGHLRLASSDQGRWARPAGRRSSHQAMG